MLAKRIYKYFVVLESLKQNIFCLKKTMAHEPLSSISVPANVVIIFHQFFSFATSETERDYW